VEVLPDPEVVVEVEVVEEADPIDCFQQITVFEVALLSN